MRKIYPLSISAMLLTTLWVFQASWAAQIYITEARDIFLRSAPTNESRLITKVPVGLTAEVLDTRGSWSKVRITEEDNSTKEGWIQTRFLGTDPPTGQALRMENKDLKKKLAELQEQMTELSRHEKDLTEQIKTSTEEFTRLQSKYDALVEGSADYIRIRDEYESAKTALKSAQESVQSLIQENENLKLSQKVTWFVAGAMVLLIGWLIGLFMGRAQRKRHAGYRF